MSLSLNFISGCNYKGEYINMKKQLTFLPESNTEIFRKLWKCKNRYEGESWLRNCVFICE